MEFPIPPEARAAEADPPQLQPENTNGDMLRRLWHTFPVLVIVTLISSVSFTIARLVLIVSLKKEWSHGVPTLCYGVVASLPYGAYTAETAFTFEAISNALAIPLYRNMPSDTCRQPKYSLGLGNSLMLSTYRTLCSISALDFFATIVILGICWGKLFAGTCEKCLFKLPLVVTLIMSGLDGGAIYESVQTGKRSVSVMSVLVLLCTISNGLLAWFVLRSKINVEKEAADILEVPNIFTDRALKRATRRAMGRGSRAMTGSTSPQITAPSMTMFNPRNS